MHVSAATFPTGVLLRPLRVVLQPNPPEERAVGLGPGSPAIPRASVGVVIRVAGSVVADAARMADNRRRIV